MKQFYSSDQFKIKSRGTVYVIELEPEDKFAVGEEILLDGSVKRITGIDMIYKLRKERKVAIFAEDVV